MSIEKLEECPDCKAPLRDAGYDLQHCPCGWDRLEGLKDDPYQGTVARLEANLSPIDRDAALASLALTEGMTPDEMRRYGPRRSTVDVCRLRGDRSGRRAVTLARDRERGEGGNQALESKWAHAMTEEIEDALYSACNVTTRWRPSFGSAVLPDHPRASGTFREPPSSVREFTAKLRAFLGEIDATLSVGELLEELE